MTNALELNVPDGLPFINFSRELDYPVSQVFRAYQDPDLIVQWLGPRGMKMEIEHYDFRSGGSYRYIHTGPDGVDFTRLSPPRTELGSVAVTLLARIIASDNDLPADELRTLLDCPTIPGSTLTKARRSTQ